MKVTSRVILTSLMLLLFACNGGGGDRDSTMGVSTNNNTTVIEIVLTLNVRTEVFAGQSYFAKSSDALVTVEHNETTGKKYVTLTQGEGVIISR